MPNMALFMDVDSIVKLALEYPQVVAPTVLDGQPTGLLEEHSAHSINSSKHFLRIAAPVRDLGTYSFIAHPFVSLVIEWAKATNTTVLFINLQETADEGYKEVSSFVCF